MMYRIGISDLEVSCIIGCLEEERKKERKIFLDIAYKIKQQKMEDHVDSSVDYEKVCNTAIQIAKEGKFHLLETLAKKIAEEVLQKFLLVLEVSVKVKKPKALQQAEFCYVECELKRI